MEEEDFTVQNPYEGLSRLGKHAHSLGEFLQADVTPHLSIYTTNKLTKTFVLSGGYCNGISHFKIEHNLPLEIINNPDLDLTDEFISVDYDFYEESKGREFVAFDSEKIQIGLKPWEKLDKYFICSNIRYATPIDKFEKVEEDILNKEISLGDFKDYLKDFGIAEVWRSHRPIVDRNIPNNDLWRELLVGINNASKQDYLHAGEILSNYIQNRIEGRENFYCDPRTMLEKSLDKPYLKKITPRDLRGMHIFFSESFFYSHKVAPVYFDYSNSSVHLARNDINDIYLDCILDLKDY